MLALRRRIWKETYVIIRYNSIHFPPFLSRKCLRCNLQVICTRVLKKIVASPFIPQELCLKYGLSHQPCDSKLHLLIASPNLVQNRSPNSSFHQRGLHNWDTTNIANERMACARSGPKNKTRPMATESEGQLELRRVLPTQSTL